MTDLVTITPIKFVKKGWGGELIIANTKDYCGKILCFNKDKSCSFHYHKLKAESFFLAKGKILLYYSWGDDLTKAEQTILYPEMKFDIPIGLRHKMYAFEESELYEFSTHHEDSDSYRIVQGD